MENKLYKKSRYNEKPYTKETGLDAEVINMFRYLDNDQTHLLAEDINALIKAFNQTTCRQQPFEDMEEQFMDYQIPEEPLSIDEYISRLRTEVIHQTVQVNQPTYIGHMTSALPYFMHQLASLVVAMNQNMVKVETSKGLTPCERETIGRIHQLMYRRSSSFYQTYLQNKEVALGGITSGGTIANLTALWCARNKLLGTNQHFEGVEKSGLKQAMDNYGYEELVIIGSENMHYSFQKAVTLLGIGEDNLITVKEDKNGSMNIKELEEVIDRCKKEGKGIIALIGVAGSTNSGRIDPLVQLGAIAKKEKLYFHVDAAWGGPVMFSDQYKYLMEGIEEADSITIDGHKQLYVPMGCGMVLFKDPKLPKGIEKHTSYILRKTSADLGKFSLEGSRPAVSLYIDAALHLLGKKGYEVMINKGINLVKYASFYMSNLEEFEQIEEPKINILIYRLLPKSLLEKWRKQALSTEELLIIDEFNTNLQKMQRENQQSFVSRTQIRCATYPSVEKITVLRMVIANPLTSKEDIRNIFEEQRRYAKVIEQRMH